MFLVTTDTRCRQLTDMQIVNIFLIFKPVCVLTLTRFQWQGRESVVLQFTGLITIRPVYSSWSGFHDVSDVISIPVSPRSEFIPEKRLSLGLCLQLFPDHSVLNRPTWVLRVFCLVLSNSMDLGLRMEGGGTVGGSPPFSFLLLLSLLVCILFCFERR